MNVKQILQNATAEALKIAVERELDPEVSHIELDELLLDTITAIGKAQGCEDDAKALVAAWNSTDKWYA